MSVKLYLPSIIETACKSIYAAKTPNRCLQMKGYVLKLLSMFMYAYLHIGACQRPRHVNFYCDEFA